MRWSWAYAPFVAVGLAAAANAVAITYAVRVRPQSVEDHPFLASAKLDAHKAACARFAELGLRLETRATTGAVELVLAGGAISDVELSLYRPDDRALDQVVAWGDPAQSLALPLRPGPWKVLVTGRRDGEAVAAETVLRVPAR